METDKAKSEKGSILGGPTYDELVEACIKKTPVIFNVDGEIKELTVIVRELTDLKHPSVNRWKVNANTVEGDLPIVFYYLFPTFRGLYTFV